MLIYYIVFGGLFLTAIWDMVSPFTLHNRKCIFWFWVAVLVLFRGLRWDTGADWSQYCITFDKSSWDNIFTYWRYGTNSRYLEFGYVFLNAIVKTFLPHYTFFLLITNVFILLILAKAVYNYIPRYQLIGLALLLVSSELFPVRQTLTVAIFCYSLKFVLTRSFKKYALCMLICFTIHRSSLILLPFYFLMITDFKYKRNVLIYIVIIVGSELFYRLFDFVQSIAVVDTMTGGLLNTYDATSEVMQTFQGEMNIIDSIATYASSIIQLSIFAYTFAYLKEQRIGDKYLPIMNLALNVYFIFLCLNAIAINPGFGSISRIANTFSIGYVFCISFSVFVLFKKKLKILSLLLFVLAFFIKYNTHVIAHPESMYYKNIVPYKSFLEQDAPIRSGRWIY